MKNLKFLALVLFTAFGLSQANGQAFNGTGDQKVNIGFSAYGNGTGLQGTYDYGIHEYFSVGAGAEFYFGNDDDDDSDFYLFARADGHIGSLLNMPSEMDLYPGLDLGLLGDDFGIGGHLGFRYFFTPNIGAYIELGSRGSLGVSIAL